MNKVAKILSAVVSVAVALSLALVMLTSALAAPTTTFSVNVVEDTAEKIVVTVVLEDGGFESIDFGIDYNTAKIEKCSAMVPTTAFTATANPVTCLFSAAIVGGYSVKDAVLATYTFDKIDGAEIAPEDITLVVDVCGSITEQYDVVIENNIPEIEAPTEPSTEATEPSTEATEPSTEATEPSTEATEPSTEATEPSTEATEPSTEATEPSTEATEPSTEATEPSTEATEPSTEATEPSTEATEPSTEATEPSTEATEPSTEDKTDAPAEDKTDAPAEDKTDAPAEDKTDAPVADGEVVNPDTGDSVTASAAIISLLAVSGAAIVALRKKED